MIHCIDLFRLFFILRDTANRSLSTIFKSISAFKPFLNDSLTLPEIIYQYQFSNSITKTSKTHTFLK